jgi:CheY-like chemotaxis protein
MTTRRLRVLLAEKRLTEAGIILRSICAEAGWALELVFVGTRGELGRALKAHSPDLALLDLSLLQPEAATYLRVLHLANSHVPFILFADPADKGCAVECLSMGARDFLLEGYLDERTVARVLQSAVGEGEAEAVMPASDTSNSEWCAFSVQLETLEEMQDQMDSRAVDRAMRGLVEVLKRNVRPRDQVVPRRCGQIDLVLADANESCLGRIIERIQARVKAYKGPLLGEMSTAVMVRAGRGAAISRPLIDEAFRCAAGGENCTAQAELILEERR